MAACDRFGAGQGEVFLRVTAEEHLTATLAADADTGLIRIHNERHEFRREFAVGGREAAIGWFRTHYCLPTGAENCA